jgi:hypothetical protein
MVLIASTKMPVALRISDSQSVWSKIGVVDTDPERLPLQHRERGQIESPANPLNLCTYTWPRQWRESGECVNPWSHSSHPNRNGSPGVTLFITTLCFPGIPKRAKWGFCVNRECRKGYRAIRSCYSEGDGFTGRNTFGKLWSHSAFEFSDTTGSPYRTLLEPDLRVLRE